MSVYTRTGDDGTTKLLYGGLISKTDPRCEAYGEADLAVSAMGLARAMSNDNCVKNILLRTQREMFTVMSELATDTKNYNKFKTHFRIIQKENVSQIENWIDDLTAQIDLPDKFTIPGASMASGALDLARSALRSAERRMVALYETDILTNQENLSYVNRLGDLLYVLARYEDREVDIDLVTGTRI